MVRHLTGKNDRHSIINFTGFIINKKFFFGISCSSLINLHNKQKKQHIITFLTKGDILLNSYYGIYAWQNTRKYKNVNSKK